MEPSCGVAQLRPDDVLPIRIRAHPCPAVRLVAVIQVDEVEGEVGSFPRRPLRAPENALGDRLAAIAELDDDALNVLNGVIDGLLARTRLTTLTADIS